jgi:hypothetical protein
MTKFEWFRKLDDQRYPILKFDDQNQTEVRVELSKIFFLHF